MQKAFHCVFILWICIWNPQTIMGDYDVSIRLLEYTRDQNCSCDSGLWGCHECDVYFQICLQPLSPTQGQICQGNNQDDRVDDTHHFLFASALRGHDTYTWSNVNGQPTFQISVHAFDYDKWNGNDDLGVTSYTYRGNIPPVLTVTTNPGHKNMRIKLNVNVSCFFMEHKNITSERNSPISLPPRDTTLGTKKGRVSSATCATCTTTSSTTIGSTTGPTTTTSSTSSTSSLSSASDRLSLFNNTISTTPNIVQTIASCLTVTTPALRTTTTNISLTSRKSSSTIPAKTTTTVQPTASFNTGKTYPPTTIPLYTPSTTGTRQTSSTTALSYTTELHSDITIQHRTGGGRLTILVLGPVSHNQLKNLSQEITKLFQHQKLEDMHFHSQIAFYHNTTDQSSTKIQIVYNYTQCNHTDDWIKDKVRLALQIMNLTLYQEKTIGKNTIANFKNNTGLVVGVVVSTLLIIVIVIGAVCWYKRKQHKKSRIKGVEVDLPSHNNPVMINEKPASAEEA
eukprot:XP_019926287.1 PREDICTED: cell wall integrity and stress response component 4-like [Crassostrea gigas]